MSRAVSAADEQSQHSRTWRATRRAAASSSSRSTQASIARLTRRCSRRLTTAEPGETPLSFRGNGHAAERVPQA